MTKLDRPIVEVASLHKAYGATVAVEDVSFTVAEGEIFGILGPNGAGKTTTVECLQGLRRPDGGALRVLGLDPTSEAEQLRRRIGSQLQDSALPGRLRVAEAIELFAAFAHHPVECDELLARWQLEEQRDQAFDSLSGGQRQRLFIALAFVNSPELVGTPAFVWPSDHAWCVAADIDPHWAGIGATVPAIERLVADPGLDAVVADPESKPPAYR